MAYLGTKPQSGFISQEANQYFTGLTQNYIDLNQSISSLSSVIVLVNGVVQENSDLTLTSSTRITLGATLVSADKVTCIYVAKISSTQAPDTGSVTLDMLSASGTKNSTTFLRGDNTFATAGGDADNYFATSGLSNKDLGVGLHVKTGDTGASAVSGSADEVVIEGTGNVGMTIQSANDGVGNIYFGDVANGSVGRVSYDHSNNFMLFNTAGSSRMKIAADGDVLIAKTSLSLGTVGHEIQATGLASHTRDSNTALQINREGSDGFVLGVHNDASFEGGITFSGGTITYSTFCGSHWSRLADNSKPTILRGTVMESISTLCDWYQAEATDDNGNKIKENISLPNGKSEGDAVTFTSQGKEYTGTYVKETNQQLPMSKISDTEDSKAVYGVFMDWDNQDDGLDGDVNDINIASLGTYIVRIHKDETVAIGDYLQSKGDGTAKKQADDILRASTIAKVTSTTKTITHADGSYCVPCTLHCG